ncbi:DEAD/DEAH box helicase [Nocardioides sp. CPCC 206347]
MSDIGWHKELALDVQFGYLGGDVVAPRQHHPQMVLNGESESVLRVLRDELKRASGFLFSVAFVSPRAIALLKQEIFEFGGTGRIVTSDYLGFNRPEAFAELLTLADYGVDVRLHRASAFHPKGYIFDHADGVTAMVGSSNLTESALVKNHEWNLKVSAATGSDLAAQVRRLIDDQLAESIPLTPEWIEQYAASFVAPGPRPHRAPLDVSASTIDEVEPHRGVVPNLMQRDALAEIADVRRKGESRAIIISATGTGKTILSALDVRAFNPRRMLFIVHREQILDRTIHEYQRVLGGPPSDYGKLSGTSKQTDRRYTFATVQTLSQPDVLAALAPDAFDYVIVDEAHRAGAISHRRVIDYFQPEFLLGMTATPERTDGFNVYELFDYNVPYEIRLTHALEADMLSPFHYYGVADVTLDDGTTATADSDLAFLITPERVDHLLEAITKYGQAGVAPRGLIFCSRKDEAHALAQALNQRTLRGKQLRTVALTGTDSIPYREHVVEELERGAIDYILTVDVFNEGVDIPSVNQVILLRQTQSAIVFVQQLGRGLRKADGKEYLVVIDVIGNYANNFLIPIALFGDESLNKESLRKNLIAAEETGVLPGLSSVRFDKVSQERVLQSIGDTTLNNAARLKVAITGMSNRVGGLPELWDFYRFESVDPVLLATDRAHFPALLKATLGEDHGFTDTEDRALGLLSHEVLTARRLHEFVILRTLLDGPSSIQRLREVCADEGLPSTRAVVEGAVDTFTLAHHAEADLKRYTRGVVERTGDDVRLRADVVAAYEGNKTFRNAVADILKTGIALVSDRYRRDVPFTPGMQYGRKEATRLLSLPRKWTSTIYGYKADMAQGVCPIFVTLHKADDVSASTAYEDAIVDRSTMVWFTKSQRHLKSPVERAIAANELDLHVFVKKDDAEGKDFYYLGSPTAYDAEDTTMTDGKGNQLPVVKMLLRFDEPIESALFDYFHPTVTL